MKKVLLTISTAASLIASDIEVYGQAHISIDGINNGIDKTATIASNSSRLGIRASYDIGNDLTAIAQFEMGVDLTGRGSNDDGNGGDFNDKEATAGLFTSARDSHVGISGNFGTLIIGNIAAQNQWIYDYNLFADQIGDLGNLLGGGGVGDDRASGAIAYTTPIFKGLDLLIAYKSPEKNDKTGNESAIFTKANYNMGNGFKVGIGYINVDRDISNINNPNEIVITSSYSKKEFSLGGGYAIMQNVGGNNVDRDLWFLGASYNPILSTTLKTHYALLDDDATDADAKMFAVGIDYVVTKNITTYLAYSATRNDSGVNYSATNWGHGQSAVGAGVGGNSPSAFSIGIIYKFRGTLL